MASPTMHISPVLGAVPGQLRQSQTPVLDPVPLQEHCSVG
jgi:hypothetical protein